MPTCFFVGHRDSPAELKAILEKVVERHVSEYGVTEFVVGGYGNFDRMAAEAVKTVKTRHLSVRLTRLLPYHPADRPVKLPSWFDGTFYPPGMEKVPKRVAIVRANQIMIKNRDFLIAYNRERIGNTRELMCLARNRAAKGQLQIENLADQDVFL